MEDQMFPTRVQIGDVTFVFKGARRCRNSTYGYTSHCPEAPLPRFWWHQNQRSGWMVGKSSRGPDKIEVFVCACKACGHGRLLIDDFSNDSNTLEFLQRRSAAIADSAKIGESHRRRQAEERACTGISTESLEVDSMVGLLVACKAALPDLVHYVSTHGPGPDKRLDAMREAIIRVES